MEKKKPHHKLDLVKSLIRDNQVTATKVAMQGANDLNLTFEDMKLIILNLTTKDFYKSMTSYADHTQWQDVYRPMTPQGKVYLKFTIIQDVVIFSFKAL